MRSSSETVGFKFGLLGDQVSKLVLLVLVPEPVFGFAGALRQVTSLG